MTNIKKASKQIKQKKGPIYNKWRNNLIKAVK